MSEILFCINSINRHSLPKGFTTKISFGNKVKTEIIAKSIAMPVKTPK